MNKLGNEETLCVKNYNAGATTTESYKDFEHLDEDTQIVSRSYAFPYYHVFPITS